MHAVFFFYGFDVYMRDVELSYVEIQIYVIVVRCLYYSPNIYVRCSIALFA